MIKVKIIALGKLKEKYLKDASAEYEKRLSRYCSLEITELDPVKLPSNPSEREISSALDCEAEMILKKIPDSAYITALCIEGKKISSTGLSDKFTNIANTLSGSFVFIIGSSYGLSEKIKNATNFKLSMSDMTFPHQLARIMLLEQIYRSFKIIEGGEYHK